LEDCLKLAAHMLNEVKVRKNIIDDDKYKYAFSVEEVNRRTLAGTPFRDAYKQVGIEIEQGKFEPNKNIHHTHEGSIGNLCNKEITALKDEVLKMFSFDKIDKATEKLIKA